jgi:secreted trypsin-like serine protease
MSRRNRSLLATLACASTVLATAPTADAAASSAVPRAHSSVVGGVRADPAKWPFAIAIFRKGRMHCSGSVIAPTKVLTAGHCVAGGFNLANFKVIVGRPTLRDTSVGQAIGVTSGRVHPDFEQTGLHDVAVLTLAQPASVTPVALATSQQNALLAAAGAQLEVAGYGATNPFGTHLSGFLKSTFERVRTEKRCLKAYTSDLFATESMICSLGARRKNGGRFKIHTSACSGDSGGPLIANTPAGPLELGTVSFGGALCGLPSAPSVYSRVSDSLGFINAG